MTGDRFMGPPPPDVQHALDVLEMLRGTTRFKPCGDTNLHGPHNYDMPILGHTLTGYCFGVSERPATPPTRKEPYMIKPPTPTTTPTDVAAAFSELLTHAAAPTPVVVTRPAVNTKTALITFAAVVGKVGVTTWVTRKLAASFGQDVTYRQALGLVVVATSVIELGRGPEAIRSQAASS